MKLLLLVFGLIIGIPTLFWLSSCEREYTPSPDESGAIGGWGSSNGAP